MQFSNKAGGILASLLGVGKDYAFRRNASSENILIHRPSFIIPII